MQQILKKSSGVWGFLQQKGRIWILLGGALAGILLLLCGSAFEKESGSESPQASPAPLAELSAYEAQLEGELEHLCEAVGGVGQAEVMLRLCAATRVVYATNSKGEPVTVGNGASEQGLTVTLCAPEIAGVGVVCRGGNHAAVQQKLTELISTTLGIPSNRVFVTGK